MKESLTQKILQAELEKNENPLGFKICIKELLKGVQDRAYWYFTTDEAEFLSNVYSKEVEEEMLRKRLKQITDEAMDSVFSDIISGELTKITVEPKELITTVKILEKVESITLEGHDYYSPEHPVARENIEKIRMINEEQKLFKERIEMIKQKERERKLEKEAMEKEIQQKIAEEKKLEYHKQVMHRMEIMRVKEEERIEQNEKFKSFLKEFKKSKPLHVLMEEEFKEKVELPQLEENKKKLELYKYKQKPTLEEINDHERTFMALKENRPEKTYVKHHTIDVGFKSEFYKKIEEEEKNGYENEYSSMIWDQMEKKKRYSLMVKENFKPKTSRVHQTLNASVDDSRQMKSEKKIAPDLSRVKEIGKFYLEYVKSLEKNRSNSATVEKQEETYEGTKTSRSRYTNYLEELKKNTDSSRYRGLGTDWKADLNDRTASKSEKRDRILIKSKQLEEKAMRDEMFIKNFNYGKAEDIIGKKKEVDETLLSAIKAKMALLKEVRES